MSKNKSKIVKWEYVTKPFDVYVLPAHVNRTHTPLITSLEAQKNGYYPLNILRLRPCVQGLDENGAVVKFLYCTRDGRFFVRGKDGWNEVLPNTNFMRRGFRSKASGGGFDAPRMRDFGHKYCHRCVAVAWCNPPKEALTEINDRHIKKKWEVDHLNTDHKNWTADNLQWVTMEENRRRGAIARRMRKMGLDPKLLTPTLLRWIYSLTEDMIEPFISACSEMFAKDPSPLSAEAIRLDVARVLGIITQQLS